MGVVGSVWHGLTMLGGLLSVMGVVGSVWHDLGLLGAGYEWEQ